MLLRPCWQTHRLQYLGTCFKQTAKWRRSTGSPHHQNCRCLAVSPPAPSATKIAAAAKQQSPASANNIIDDVAASRGGVAKVVLKGGKARLFRDGNPMVYSGAVAHVQGRPAPKTGDAVVLADGNGAAIGWGVFNPDSMFRVRVLQLAEEAQAKPNLVLNTEAVLAERIREAVTLRRTMGLPSEHTTVYRLCNSEGDRLSGLVADVLGATIVVNSSSAFVERHKEQVRQQLAEATGLQDIVWRPSMEILREEGLSPDADGQADEIQQPAQANVEVLENGVKYLAAPWGQKTGYYADQRDSRAVVRALAGGKRVLDLCCYSGGFALNAALGGATSVTGVDTSGPAIQLARQNAELNGLSEDDCSFHQQDVKDFMMEAAAEGKAWDLIILDPPKLAPNRKSLAKATHRYRALNRAAMRLLPPEGGLLMTCSCSGAMTQSGQLLSTLQEAARAAGRGISVVRKAGAGPDHPLDPAYPEGEYLSNVLLHVRS